MPAAKNKEAKKASVFSIYRQETQRYPWLFIAAIVGILLEQAADLAAPLYLKKIFNTLVANTPSAAIIHALIMLLTLVATFYLVGWVGDRIVAFSLNASESRIMTNLYNRAFEYLIGHSYHFFSSQFSGTLTRRVSKFANAYENLYDAMMAQFIPTTLFVVGAVTILFIRSRLLGIMLALWAIFFVCFQLYVARHQRPMRIASAEEDSRLTGALADAISNQNTITLFSGRNFEQGRFSEASERWRAVTYKSWRYNARVWAALSLFSILINVSLLAGALYLWQRGQLTVGDFVLIQAYLLTTVQQLIGINRNLRRFYDSYADASEMMKILNTPHEIQDMPGAKAIQIETGRVEFKDVQFYFHANRQVLRKFNLGIAGGEKVALVGPSGAGKSTITRLLLRFYDVKEGSIVIDDQDIRNVTQNSLREAIAFVPQEPILFHRTLMENIRYGRRDATDEEVIEAAKKAHCHEFITGFPEGYETFVGERGVKLSGGERQRVAIARAILKDAPLLILDEATSSLDSESESLIQDALRILMEGKTVIVIAHRLSTIMSMDRIVVVEDGQIAAQGTHDELLADTSGLYHKLWSIQAGGFIVDEDADEEAQKEDVEGE